MWIFESARQQGSSRNKVSSWSLFDLQNTTTLLNYKIAKTSLGMLVGFAISAASTTGYGQEAVGTWQAPNTPVSQVEQGSDLSPAIEFAPVPPLPNNFLVRQQSGQANTTPVVEPVTSPSVKPITSPTISQPNNTAFESNQSAPTVNATIVRNQQLPNSSAAQENIGEAAGLNNQGVQGPVQNAGGSLLQRALNQESFNVPQGVANAIPQSESENGSSDAQQVSFLKPASIVAKALGQDPAQSPIPVQDPDTLQEEDSRQLVAQVGPDSETIPGLSGETTIFFDNATGEFVIVGSDEDIAIAREALNEIINKNQQAPRESGFIELKYSTSEDVVEIVQETYDANNASVSGKAEIRALKTPNGLLVTATPEGIEAVRKIVAAMEPTATEKPEGESGFKRFLLKHISAVDAKRRLDGFFGQLNGGGENSLPPEAVTIVADTRSNVIVVKGNPQLIRQAEAIIESIDVDEEAKAVDVVRVFPLQNTVASDLQVILQDAINGQILGAGSGFNPNQQLNNAQNLGQSDENSNQIRPSRLQLQSLKDGKLLESGLLFGVRVSAEAASNSLIVRGPESSMPLIAELIRQLDRLPSAETQIKVFQVINGDAQQLLDMLEQIFGTDQNANQNLGGNGNTSLAQLPLQTAGASPGAPLVDLRFAVEQRTNSIIATGSASELQVVESLLNRLDENVGTRRQTVVYRLSNSPVLDVEEALNVWITAQNERIQNDPRSSGGSVQANLGVIVASEVVSNSLIINALPEQFAELERVIQSLDRRPPMVKVECLIAEVDLGTLEEFGVELGLQDSLLFDRGTSVAADGTINGIGFPFNSNEVANQNASFQETVAGQALSNLGLGRINSEVGYGGLVLSAGNESVNILMRALKDKQCLRVLSRPTIMTMENLQGRTSVGQQISRITGTTQNAIGGGVSNNVQEVSVGVILEVTPRVSPDGMIVMFVNAVKSSLGSEADGVVVAVDATGAAVRQAPINATEAQTTIMARSGQTVVFSGLIQETKQHSERGTPILSDLPFIGPLFKFESDEARRSELLIVMTPYLIDGEGDVEAQNRAEMDRMHWCLCDVSEMYGNMDYQDFQEDQGAMNTYYPDQDPTGMMPQQYQNSTEIIGQPLSEKSSVMRQVQQASGAVQAGNQARQAKFEEPVKEESRGLFSEWNARHNSRRARNTTPGNRSGFDEYKTRFNKK